MKTMKAGRARSVLKLTPTPLILILAGFVLTLWVGYALAAEPGLDPRFSDIPTTKETLDERRRLLIDQLRKFALEPTPAGSEYGNTYDTPYCRDLLKAFNSQEGIEHRLPRVAVRGLNEPALRKLMPSCPDQLGYYHKNFASGGYVATPFYKLWRINGGGRQDGADGDYLMLEESFFPIFHRQENYERRVVGTARYLQLDPKTCLVRDLHLDVREYVPPPPADLPAPTITRSPDLSLHGVVDYRGETVLYRMFVMPTDPRERDRLIIYRFDASRPVAACMYRVKPN